MLKVALTGGIATGKTYVLRRLRERGVATIDADEIVHEALRGKTPITNAIALEFGGAVIQADGSVDRAVLADKVFGDADARLRLEAIVHPHVYKTISSWFNAADRDFAVACIPLLYETRREGDFDVVVVTSCEPEQQVERMVARGLSEKEARRRMAAQIASDEKTRRADYVISTSGTEDQTDTQVNKLLAELNTR